MTNLDERQTATVLAALRFWQALTDLEERDSQEHFADLGPDGALTDDEIDSLCERLNMGGA